MRSRNFLGALAMAAMMGSLDALADRHMSSGTNQAPRRQQPRTDIERWNAEVDERKAEKRARKGRRP